MKNTSDDKIFRDIASKYGIEISESKRIVNSFFEILQLEARALPFDDDTRIYTREKFGELVSVYQIPFVGRLGPVYSKYLSWRKNDVDAIEQMGRNVFRKVTLKEKAEMLAKQILSGNTVSGCSFKEFNRIAKHKRVWMVGVNGKKLANQVISVKNEE